MEQNGASEEAMQIDGDMPATEECNIALLKVLMARINEEFSREKVKVDTICKVYYEWIKVFHHLGKALYIAF